MEQQAIAAKHVCTLANPQPLLPHVALVIHSRRQNAYSNGDAELVATTHPVEVGEDGRWHFKPGNVATASDQRAMGEALLESAAKQYGAGEIMPEGMIMANEKVCAWFRPARQRFMHVAIGGERRAVNVRWPNLVMAHANGELFLAATDSKSHPDGLTKLYRAPLGNVYASTKVCLGNARVPRENGISAIEGWDKVVFDSAFTHTNCASMKGQESGMDVAHYWKQRDGKANAFPKAKLLPLDMTLAAWLKAIVDGGLR
jgi:PRTRC genetic system protein B